MASDMTTDDSDMVACAATTCVATARRRGRQPDHGATTRAPALHFVGFRGDEYSAAVRVFGPPDFIHIGWDRWAKLEVVPGDTAIFARGDFDAAPSLYSYPDVHET